jgi:hypothetical protein
MVLRSRRKSITEKLRGLWKKFLLLKLVFTGIIPANFPPFHHLPSFSYFAEKEVNVILSLCVWNITLNDIGLKLTNMPHYFLALKMLQLSLI